MEYERFFHAGSDPLAAKWYLLKASYDLPQRLLCNEQYAIKNLSGIPRFGRYTHRDYSGATNTYCYVLVNIFDIPFFELDNFFALQCDNTSSRDPYDDSGNSTFNVNFVPSFVAAHTKAIKDVDLVTNRDTVSSDYLRGLELMQKIDFNVKMKTLPCDNRPTTIPPSTSTSLTFDMRVSGSGQGADSMSFFNRGGGMSTCKRRNTNDIDDPTQRKQPPPPPSQSSTGPQQMCTDDIFAPIPPTNTITGFPSIMPDYEDDDILSGGGGGASNDDIIGDLSIFLDGMKIRNLGQDVLASSNNQILADEYERRIEFRADSENNMYAFFVDRQTPSDDVVRSENRVRLNPEAENSFRALVSGGKILSLPAVYVVEDEPMVKLQLSSDPGNEFEVFDNYVREMGPQIQRIVESANDQEFQQRVQEANNVTYWLLYGLYRYMKNQQRDYTTLMEIAAVRHYGSTETYLLSETYARLYFAFIGRVKLISANTMSLNHLRGVKLPNRDISSNMEIASDAATLTYLQNEAIPAITQGKAKSLRVTPLQTTNRIAPEPAFGLNVIAVDNTLMYIVDTSNAYLLVRRYINPMNIADTVRNVFAQPQYNVFDTLTYRGLATK